MRIVIVIYLIICHFWTSCEWVETENALKALDRRLCEMICNPQPEFQDEILPTILNYNGLMYHLYREFNHFQHIAWEIAVDIHRHNGPLYLQAHVNLREFKRNFNWTKEGFYNLVDYMLDSAKMWKNMSDVLLDTWNDISEAQIYD